MINTSTSLPGVSGCSLLQSRAVTGSTTLTCRNCALHASPKIYGIRTVEALVKPPQGRQELRVAEQFSRFNSPIAVELTFQLVLDDGCDPSVSTACKTPKCLTTNLGVRIGQPFMKRRPKRGGVRFELTPQGERRPIPHIPIGVATQPYESVDNRRRIVWHQAMYGRVSEVGTRMLDEWQ
jgi:hypothetical protein